MRDKKIENIKSNTRGVIYTMGVSMLKFEDSERDARYPRAFNGTFIEGNGDVVRSYRPIGSKHLVGLGHCNSSWKVEPYEE